MRTDGTVTMVPSKVAIILLPMVLKKLASLSVNFVDYMLSARIR